MWFAARDIAFESPDRQDRRRRHARPHGLRPARVSPAAASTSSRALPDDIDINLELIANLMIRVLLIEMQAFHTFAWAEDVAVRHRPRGRRRRGGRARVATSGPTRRPHVGYLKTALTEMRDRTWVGERRHEARGRRHDRHLWDSGLDAVARRGP